MSTIAQDNRKAEIKEITERIETGVKELFESERYQEYLQVMSKFHNYSFNNVMLIAMQKPDASHIAGFSAWKNKFGRNVMKGEKGIRIIAPSPYKIKQEMNKIDPVTKQPVIGKDGKPVIEEQEITIPAFKVVSVFDVSQTEGKELPSIGASELTGNVERYADFFKAAELAAPVPVGFEKIGSGSKGYYSQIDKRIAINEGMSELQNLKTLIHEIAHAKLHDVDLNVPLGEQAERPDRRTREIQAESIAYTVCQYYGLDTSDYSFSYVAQWSSGRELAELKASLEIIRNTVSDLIKDIDKNFAELTKDKEQTQENQEPTVTIIWSESDRLQDGEVIPFSRANALFEELDEEKHAQGDSRYFKTKFQINYMMDGTLRHYDGQQDFGDGDGSLIQHIEKFHSYYLNNEEWNNHLLRTKGQEAVEEDKEQRTMLLNEFIPYLKLHNNLSIMEQLSTKALKENSDMGAYHIAMQEYVFKCRSMVNQGNYELPTAPHPRDFKTELEAYKEHIREEIAQEAAAAGMTVEKYAANGYEPYDTLAPWMPPMKEADKSVLEKRNRTSPARRESVMSKLSVNKAVIERRERQEKGGLEHQERGWR
ncbi:MAG: ArdC-like ssDNA-binding domain-containing protein [Bacillus sp. (in: Bacteria)]|nr:ArdC-like ssDNA-binding domain-containing protein [Bacillus sp. (in: firmicutes)]